MNNLYEVIIKLLLALVLGGLVGYEREHKKMPAGFRTHILVCIGAALVQITSVNFYAMHPGKFNTDPMRLGAQVISGIGFLGAGTILKEGATVKGLTTAAGIWAVACIGIAVGTGLYMEAIVATVFLFIALIILKKFENKIVKNKRYLSLQIIIKNIPGKLGQIRSVLGELNVQTSSIDIPNLEDDYVTIDLVLKVPSQISDEIIMEKLLEVGNLKEVNIQ